MGYLHYEISSFARNERFFCKHNEVYWQGDEDFFAFGMGATSLIQGKRSTRPKTLKKYFEFSKVFNEKFLEVETEIGLDRVKTVLMGGLRTKKGVFIAKFEEKYQKILEQFCDENCELVEIDKDNLLKVKGIKGFLLCDEILVKLFVELEKYC